MRIKFWQVGLMTSLLTISLSLPALAGQWKEEDGGWKYVENDGTIVTDSWRRSEDKKYYYLVLKNKELSVDQQKAIVAATEYASRNGIVLKLYTTE